MSEKQSIRGQVMAGKSHSDQQLIQNTAEGLDAIRNDRLGFADPVEDWLYDAAHVLIMDIREWDKNHPETQP